MSLIIPRTVTEIRDTNTLADAGRTQANAERPLASFRSTSVYVLLGDPGAGKTTVFTSECTALGETACYVTARDFLAFSPDDHPEWRGKTLFIDGLDERRAGSPDKLAPFDRIRGHLDKLGKPRFRLSCRTADWLGENDRRHLASVTPRNSEVTILRLDPLTDSDARKILQAGTGIPDAASFIATAKERGVDALLRNPQSLCLLADVVASGGTWPDSRRETFEQACRHLAAEHNQNRRYVTRAPAVDCTLDAAGRLCAIFLLSGAAGYASDPDQADDDYLDIDRCGYDRNTLLQALSTKLFTAAAEGRFKPVHRHLAAFLAARHIERLIADGSRLPRGRVLALICGEDGTVVTEHRGLSAWLAALCRDARPDLIERDPIGVVSYGDVRSFTTDEKCTLLVSLSREAERLHCATWTREAVAALATRDMESALHHALKSRSEEPYFTALVLLALTHGTPLTGIADYLFEMVYQRHRWAQIPGMILDAFLHNCPSSTARDKRLERLLADLTCGRVSDWNNELLGTVLTVLYPRRISPSQIWDYLPVTAQRFASGPYHHFWHFHLIESSSDIGTLLDSLTAQREQLKQALESHHLQAVPLKLLARGIERYGESLDIERLCDWLTVGMFPDRYGMAIEAVDCIRRWLEERPNKLKAVIAEVARRPVDLMSTAQSRVDQIRYGADFPPDYGLWCLQQAVASNDVLWTRHFLYACCRSLADQRHARGLNLDVLFKHTQDSAKVRKILQNEMLVCRVAASVAALHEQRSYVDERERNHSNWIADVRSNVDDLRSGHCALDILYWIGRAYFGSVVEAVGSNADERIRNLFRDEELLIEAALVGIRGTLSRNDIPAPAEIIGHTGSGQEYRIGLPFLAGMEEIEPEEVLQLSDRQVRQAVAFHFCHYRTPDSSTRQGSGWYRLLLDRYPETVADVLVRCVAAVLRTGKHDDSIVYQLLDDDHARVARHAAMPILRGFPLRCSVPQLLTLDHLLHAAHRHGDRESLRYLIAERLRLTSMTVAQRVHWLAMGVIVRPLTYLDPLQEFVQRREKRISHLAEFLLRAGPTIDELTVPALNYYVSLLGSTIGRWISRDSGILGVPAPDVSPCVYEMIQRLAGLPQPDASEALDALVSDAALSSWHANLIPARDRQRVIRRDARYRHPTVDQTCNTLHHGPPANPADLAALVADRLHEIAVLIRNGNTDDWQQYWNVDHYGRPLSPKPENLCRNALLSDLQQRLRPIGVEATREAQHANSRRTDIQVSYDGCHLPIEAKRNDHRDLWTAMRNQLIKQYVSDPEAGGYGIYLVFWFGAGDTPRSPSGVRPTGPAEVREQLEALLSEEERRAISVCVIDVTAPA